MSGREAFEKWWALSDEAPFDRKVLAWEAWQARDAEIAAKDARIAELETALRKIKGLPRFDQYEEGPSYGYLSPDGEWLVSADVDDIIEEALR